MSTRLVVQGGIVVLVGVLVLLGSRRLAEHAVPRSWPEPFGRRFDGQHPLRTFTWGYRLAGLGAVILGGVWVAQGLM
jgi:hypothetical protein